MIFLGILLKVILWVLGELHDFLGILLKVILLVWGEPRDFWAFYSKSYYGSWENCMIFLVFYSKSYYWSGENRVIFLAFYSKSYYGSGENCMIFGQILTGKKHYPFKWNPVYLNFLDMHIVWCGSNLESADFLLFQGHVNLLHVFLRRH